jgi:hypothetical protein
MNAGAIRAFLIQQPPLTSIRLTDANGDTSLIEPGKRSKAKVAETIAAMAPDLIECLDKDGNLLRATRPESTMPARGATAPALPPELQRDPESLRLTHFANLVHRAYEHATDIAFAKLVELVERMDQRSESIEQRLERAEAGMRREQRERLDDMWDRVAEAAERAESGDSRDQIVTGLLQGALAGKAQQAKPNGANGKARP